MKPLLEIQSIPISITYKVTPAQVERRNVSAEVEIRRDNKGLQMRSRPIRLNIDSFEAKNSIARSPMRSVLETSDRGREAALAATAVYAKEGHAMVNIHLDQNVIPKLATERFNAPLQADFNIRFIPDQPMNMDWVPGELEIDYEMDKLNFDWKTNRNDIHFTPGSIEFVVEEYPRVVVEFVGDPIYVPPSANPNYVDTHA